VPAKAAAASFSAQRRVPEKHCIAFYSQWFRFFSGCWRTRNLYRNKVNHRVIGLNRLIPNRIGVVVAES
jgi:hypothetical protein